MAFDIKEHIRKFIKSRLGAPIAALCSTESSAIDEAFEFAAIDYWTALPYVKKYNHGLTTGGGELHLNVDDYKSVIIPADLQEHVFFLGIVREDMEEYDVASSVGGLEDLFNTRLLGGGAGPGQGNTPTRDPRYLADRIQYFQSTEGSFIGEVDISIDQVNNEVVVTYPPIDGQLHLWWAWGFCPDETIKRLPMNHLSLFRRMVALQLIEIVIASRSAVQLNADFSIDVSDLQAKRDRLQEELDTEIPNTALFVAQWG